MNASDPHPERLNHHASDAESNATSSITSDERAPQVSYRNTRSNSLTPLLKLHRWRSGFTNPIERFPKARITPNWRRFLIIFGVLCFMGVMAGITYISLVVSLISRLSPPTPQNGLQGIVKNWKEPNANGAYRFPWPENFSRDIVPKACHSHNDYWRRVPLYEALAAGCVSIEADVWLKDNDLPVGHVKKVLKSTRTLQTLYIEPLINILSNRKVSTVSESTKEVGVFETDPNAAVILMLDFKTDGHDLWPVVLSQLEPLRQKGWLTYFNGTDIIPGPVTVVGTGNTPFDLVTANFTYRYVFFDAPLLDVSNNIYTVENSYYASTALKSAIGRIWFRKLSGGQIKTIKTQIEEADAKGLKSRYWGTPAWPISFRGRIWNTLVENGVGMLNVDDLISATRWNWDWCIVAGLTLCG